MEYMKQQQRRQTPSNSEHIQQQKVGTNISQEGDQDSKLKQYLEQQQLSAYEQQYKTAQPPQVDQTSQNNDEKYLAYLEYMRQHSNEEPKQDLQQESNRNPQAELPQENKDQQITEEQYQQYMMMLQRKQQMDMEQSQQREVSKAEDETKLNKEVCNQSHTPNKASNIQIESTGTGRITKANYVPGNPYSSKNYAFGDSALSTNPITRPVNSYKFNYNR